VIEKLNFKKRVWEKEENRMSIGKDGRLLVYHDQVVHAVNGISILSQQETQM
jgi:hypothetical protein